MSTRTVVAEWYSAPLTQTKIPKLQELLQLCFERFYLFLMMVVKLGTQSGVGEHTVPANGDIKASDLEGYL